VLLLSALSVLIPAGVSAGSNNLRWGIAGAGKISHDFAIALTIHNSTMGAVAAGVLGDAVSRQQRATNFAATFEIPRSYSSYDSLATDEDIDIV
jgi:dihydrodiol dehydrogenase / D-xylose 1-dehydrogenase (NADP)